MTAECFQAIIVICGIFTVCELIGKKINYKIPTLVLVMIVFIIFGGQLGIIPEDILETSGFSQMVYSFGLPFVLAGFGTGMSLASIKDEGKTVIISLTSIACILILGGMAGFLFMDSRTAVYGAVEVAGGGQAGLIFLTHLQGMEGTESLIALMLCLMNMQLIFGYPLCSLAMRKSMEKRIAENRIPDARTEGTNTQRTERQWFIRIPEELKNNTYYVFLMLGMICFLSVKLYEVTSLSSYLWYILFGFCFAEFGLLEHNCLAKSGLAKLMFDIMFAMVISDFLTLNLSDVAAVSVNFILLILFGIAGCIISGFLMSKIFRIDIFEGFAVSIGCMVGYPPSQKVTADTLQAVCAKYDISEDTVERLRQYYEPKIIISGVVSISLVTGLLAGIIVSFL